MIQIWGPRRDVEVASEPEQWAEIGRSVRVLAKACRPLRRLFLGTIWPLKRLQEGCAEK